MGPHPGRRETTLTPATSWGKEPPSTPGGVAVADVFARYAPPFDLTSDLLFALALGRTAPLRQAFPGVPFLSCLGKTPLLIWFSRVTEACFGDPAGERRCEGGPAAVLYHELNVFALLRQPALFVPGIYATSERSVRIGHGYGMPKEPTTMSLEGAGQRFESSMPHGARRTFVRARLLRHGEVLAKPASLLWPRRVWPVRFPSGSNVRGLIQAVPSAQIAHVRTGQLSLDTAWLPRPIRLLPVGLYLPGLRMQLPPPEQPYSVFQNPIREP